MEIGEGSLFHAESGYYAKGADLSLAELPHGWRDRIIELAETAVAALQPSFDS